MFENDPDYSPEAQLREAAERMNDPLPPILKPGDGPAWTLYLHDARPGELDWVPVLRPVKTSPSEAEDEYPPGIRERMPDCVIPIKAIIRPGFWEDPLGYGFPSATKDGKGVKGYRVGNHQADAKTIEASGALAGCVAKKINGIGTQVIHIYDLKMIGDYPVVDMFAPNVGRMRAGHTEPLVSRFVLVHDHTGKGALTASVVCYLGKATIGAVVAERKIHVGAGKKNVGMESASRWTGEVARMCESAIMQQSEVLDLVQWAARTNITDEAKKAFAKKPFNIKLDEKAYYNIGDEERQAKSLLDLVLIHHESQRGELKWGVWSRRLEGDALRTLRLLRGDVQVVAEEPAQEEEESE